MKKRLFYLAALLLVIVLGLLSRQISGIPLMLGDALWAVAVYLAWRLLLPNVTSRHLFLIATGTAFTVEYSQLLSWSWLVAFRQTILGHLLLGQGFLYSDLIAYLLGLLVIWGLDAFYRQHQES